MQLVEHLMQLDDWLQFPLLNVVEGAMFLNSVRISVV